MVKVCLLYFLTNISIIAKLNIKDCAKHIACFKREFSQPEFEKIILIPYQFQDTENRVQSNIIEPNAIEYLYRAPQ